MAVSMFIRIVLHATFVAYEIWGDMREAARINPRIAVSRIISRLKKLNRPKPNTSPVFTSRHSKRKIQSKPSVHLSSDMSTGHVFTGFLCLSIARNALDTSITKRGCLV